MLFERKKTNFGFTLITTRKRNVVNGFTLIELLVAIMIVGILVSIVGFGLRQAQSSARDGRRKADLENISVALELYRANCNRYPPSLSFGSTLTGTGTGTCTGTYMTLPTDPQPTVHGYSYSTNGQGSLFRLCGSLEQPPAPISVGGCSSCVGGCDWRVARP